LLSHNQKNLITLLADGEFHSGNTLSEQLGITRTAVWKMLNSLSETGISHTAVNGKGYRLNRPLELLDQQTILSGISQPALSLIADLKIFDQIPSTNTYLMNLASESPSSGLVCIAEQQTAGKGRRGRQWVSPYGSNIYLSIFWRFQASPLILSGLSLAIGVGVIRALKALYPYDFKLKWPNDIYYRDKKLGGILVEVSGESEGPCFAVIGLGLNLYLPETSATDINQPWTDLSRITGQNQLKRNNLTAALLAQLLPIISGFEQTGLAPFLDEWRSYDCLKNKAATLFLGRHSIQGIVNGIDDQGLILLTRADDGTTQAYASGEVSFNAATLCNY
jgi:BirA family transcriptional regulator, biotin operon repressor / biotin---[acetyl-CoA-carboxylase] ligase